MVRTQLRSGLAHVGLALREPEEFARRWHEDEAPYSWWVFAALALTAIVGTTTYGLTMGLLGGPSVIVRDAILCTTAAGLAWGIALPSLYIFNSLSGSRLRAGTTLLAALSDLVTDRSVVALLVRIVNLVIFTGVGVAMIDIFGRVMEALEPRRGRWPVLWPVVVSAIGAELFYAFGLFEFAVRA